MGAGAWGDSREENAEGGSPCQGLGKRGQKGARPIIAEHSTITSLGKLNTKPVLGAKGSSGMTSLLESEMMQVNQLPKDKGLQKARSKRTESSMMENKGEQQETGSDGCLSSAGKRTRRVQSGNSKARSSDCES